MVERHAYAVVTCKTLGCGNVCAFKYLGVHVEGANVGGVFPASFLYECGRCHQLHRYLLADADIQVLDTPPPAGWRDGWEP